MFLVDIRGAQWSISTRTYGLYSPIILTHTASPKPISAPTACCPSFSQLSSTCDRHLQCRLLRGGLTRSCLSLSQTVGGQMVALLPPGLATVNPRPSALQIGFLFMVPSQRCFLSRLWYQVSDAGVCCNQVFLGCQQLQTPLVGHWSVCVIFCGFSPSLPLSFPSRLP